MNLKVILEPSDEGGFTAIVPSLPGCISEGDTREDALTNIREAIALYLDPIEDDMAGMEQAEQLEVAIRARSPVCHTTGSYALYSATDGS